MSEVPGGSCESCKKKKCKCDRKAPTCGQCETSKLSCTYSEWNKRGIPTGYLSNLEQRLIETEHALCKTITEIRSQKSKQQGVVSHPGPSATWLACSNLNESKLDRMAEWKEYPLQTDADVEKWWRFFACNQVGDETNIDRRRSQGKRQTLNENEAAEYHQLSRQDTGDPEGNQARNGVAQTTFSSNEVTSQPGQSTLDDIVRPSQPGDGSLSRSKQLSAAMENIYY